MAYIGKTPIVGNFQKCDALTASGTADYTLQVSSTNVVPESANHMLVSLNGVIQQPGASGGFTVSGSTLSFNSALTSSDTIDFVILLGNVLDIGTPSDATVTNAKLGTDVISGETDIGGAIADADLMLLDDGAGGTLRKSAMSRVRTYATDCALISTTTMSGSATSVNITSGIDGTYSIYRLWYINLSAAGAGNTVFMKISSDGGSSFIGSGYIHTGFRVNYTGSATSSSLQGANGAVQIANNLPNYGDATTEGACGYVEFYTPNVSRKPVFTGMSAQFADDGDADAYYWGGHYGTATTFDAIQFSASNNMHGILKLYGYK